MIEKYLPDEDGYVSIPLGAKTSVLCNEGRIEFWAESGPKPLLERHHVVVEHHSDKRPGGYDFVGTILKYDQIHHVFLRSRLFEIMAEDAKVALAETESGGVFEGEDGIFSQPVQTSARPSIPPEHEPPLELTPEPELGHWTDHQPEKAGGPVGPGRPEGAPPVTVTLNMSQWLYARALEFVEARLALTETSSGREALIRALCVLGAAHAEPFMACGKCGQRIPIHSVKPGLDSEILEKIAKGLELPPWGRECIAALDEPEEGVVKGSELNGGDIVLLDSDGNSFSNNRCKAGAEWSVVAAARPYFSRTEGSVDTFLTMKQILIRRDGNYTRISKGEGVPAFDLSTIGTKADKVGIYRCTNIEVSRNGKDWVAQFDCDQGPIVGKGLIVYGDYKLVAPAQELLNQRHETLWLAVGTPGNYNRWSAEEPQP